MELTVHDLRTVIDCYYDDEIREIAAEMSDEELLEADIMEDFLLDSLDLVNLMISTEQVLGISFRNDDDLLLRRPEKIKDFLSMCSSLQR